MNRSPSHSRRRASRAPNPWAARVSRLFRPASTARAQMGSAGVAFLPPEPARLGLFELAESIIVPDPSDPNQPDVPYSPHAKAVWLDHRQDQYGGTAHSADVTLYHPAALRDSAGRPWNLPALCPGMRCYAWYNRQSKRWEIIAPAAAVVRFEMTAALSCGGSAEALVKVFDQGTCADDPLGRTITVHDFSQRFSKMATAAGDAGALGWARWMPDHQAWEILDMQVPGDFFGALKQDLTQQDAAQTVQVVPGTGVLNGYNVFGENFGNEIIACNPEGGGNFAAYWFAGHAGDRVFCRWDVRNAKYWILAVEPNNKDYQALDVVTGVDFAGQTVTTRQIELPPWTTIG